MTANPYRPVSADSVVPGLINTPYPLSDKAKLAGIEAGATAGGVTKRGVARSAAGTPVTAFGVPGQTFNSQGTTSFVAGRKYYLPFIPSSSPTITDWVLEVTTAPASNANIRHGIYLADADLQPTGAPLYDSGDIAVASAYVGTKTATGLSVPLPVGKYLQVVEVDVDMTLRAVNAPTSAIAPALGASAMWARFYVTDTYGALPSTPVKWNTTAASATAALPFPVFYKWTE